MSLSQMKTDRLTELCTVLRKIPRENFNLELWIDNFQNEKTDISNLSIKQKINCGTVCCAIGWACSHKPFIKQGFVLEMDGRHGWPVYKNETGWEAIEKFFKIPTEVAHYLFSDYSYKKAPKPQKVINRIQKIMTNKRFYKGIAKGKF